MAAHLLLLIAFLFPCLPGDQVEITLKTGKTVSGEILKDGKEEIILATDLGTLLIKTNTIESRKNLSAPNSPAVKEAAKQEPEKKKEDPFDLKKIVADVESRVKPEETKADSAKKGAGEKKGDPEATKVLSTTAKPKASSPSGKSKVAGGDHGVSKSKSALYDGRLLDRFAWTNKLEMGTKVSILAALYLLFWGALSVLTRLLDVENANSGKSAMAALVWVAVVVGMLFVPNPTQVIVGILGFCLLVAWLMTTRGILGATWLQSIYLFLLGSLGMLLLYLLVEVGSNILELKI